MCEWYTLPSCSSFSKISPRFTPLSVLGLWGPAGIVEALPRFQQHLLLNGKLDSVLVFSTSRMLLVKPGSLGLQWPRFLALVSLPSPASPSAAPGSALQPADTTRGWGWGGAAEVCRDLGGVITD